MANGPTDGAVITMMAALPTSLYCKMHLGAAGVGAGNPAACTTRAPFTRGAPTAGVASNTTQLAWTGAQVTATESWSYCSIWDAATAGNCLWTGTVSPAFAATAGQGAVVLVGQITFTMAEAS